VPYTKALNNLDADMSQYIHDNTEDEFSHRQHGGIPFRFYRGRWQQPLFDTGPAGNASCGLANLAQYRPDRDHAFPDLAGQGWHAVSDPLAPLTVGSLTFPNLNVSPFGGEDFQTNLMARPERFELPAPRFEAMSSPPSLGHHRGSQQRRQAADDMDAARPLTGGINGPDFGTRPFDILVHTAIPRTDADTTDKNQIQAIANTAAFHFAFIEVGGSSRYPTLAQPVTHPVVLRILLSIGPTETMHFQTWQDKAGNAVSDPLAPLTVGSLTFPNLNRPLA
jgi:hypothetical protein